MRLFVYGTLKRDCRAHILMKTSGACYIGDVKTTTKYHMYNIGCFPGIVENEEEIGNGVQGELYEIDEAMTGELDKYEGIEHGLFKKATIELEDGSQAVAYLYNLPVAWNSKTRYSKIEDGFWPKG